MLPSELKPVKFHAYTSGVLKRIVHLNFTEETDYIRSELLDLFNYHGIKCYYDNKIVFECELHGTKIYYGFYDLRFSIGLDYYDNNERDRR